MIVNDRLGVSRKLIRRLRAILHRAGREGLDPQNRDKRPHFRAWLQGMIAYVHMVQPVAGARLKAQFNAIG